MVMLALGCGSGSSSGTSTGGASGGDTRGGRSASASTASGGDKGGTSQSASSGGRGGGSLGGSSRVGGESAGQTATAGGAGGTGKGGNSSMISTGDTRPDAGWDGPVDASSSPKDTAGGKETGGGPDAPAMDTSASPSGVFKPPFILGADVTITVEDEYWGANYTDSGQAKSLEQILKDHGFNFIRIGTFVDPAASDGYAADKTSKPEAFRDLAHTISLAKRVKKVGMGVMVDFHYSDTWASPGTQTTPQSWAGLSLSALADKVYGYTKDAVTQLKGQGAMPDMVSVGNEITNGMLWDTGKITNSSFSNFATLLKAGIKAVREIDPEIVVVMHIEKCNNLATTKWWLDGVLKEGVAFDVLGQSCYASAPSGVAGFQGTPADWKSTFTQLATAYPNLKFLIAEYSAEQRAAGDVMFGLADKRGRGTFNWDPTRSYETLPNDPLFRTNGAWNRYVAIPEKMALYEQMAKDYGIAGPK
jgi:arabinogalactan endo-1,4-beta-galactosidase